MKKGRRVVQKLFSKLKASIPILYTNSNKLDGILYLPAFSAGSPQLKKPPRWPKALIGSPCHGAPGRIQSSPVLRGMLLQYRDVIVGLKDDNVIAEQLKQLIIDHMVPLSGGNPPRDMDRLLEKIMEQTVVTTLLSEIRRGFLSILRSQGYTILKTDHHPPYVEVSEVFWPGAQIDINTKNLFFSITKRYKAYKDLVPYIRMIKRLRENSYPADYLLYVYKELEKITWFYD